MLPWLAAGLDFVSIGTNDLAQYTAAADRGSHAVAELADPLGPGRAAAGDLVNRTRPAAGTVSVCGDLASWPEVTAAAGARRRRAQLPSARRACGQGGGAATELGRARVLAAQARRAPDAAGVRALLEADGAG